RRAPCKSRNPVAAVFAFADSSAGAENTVTSSRVPPDHVFRLTDAVAVPITIDAPSPGARATAFVAGDPTLMAWSSIDPSTPRSTPSGPSALRVTTTVGGDWNSDVPASTVKLGWMRYSQPPSAAIASKHSRRV